LIEAKLEGADVNTLQAGCEGLLASLEQRLQFCQSDKLSRWRTLTPLRLCREWIPS
jgi:hypothetical protein